MNVENLKNKKNYTKENNKISQKENNKIPIKNNNKIFSKENNKILIKNNNKIFPKENNKLKKTTKNLNLSKEIQDKIKTIKSLRLVYFTLGEFSEKKRKEFELIVKTKIKEFKKICSALRVRKQNIVTLKKQSIFVNDSFNKNLNTYYLYRDVTNKLFLKKFSNLLMINGNRTVAMKVLLKLFEILKLKFRISDPIIFLKTYIFKNLVPVIQSKTVGFTKKKVIGISLSVFKRIGISLKLFIKGARMYNYPIVLGLLIEFFKLIRNKSYLQMCNKKTLIDIKINKLYKYLNIEPRSLIPENKLLSSFFTKKKKNMLKTLSLMKLMQVDWLNFNEILKRLTRRNHINRMIRQRLVLNVIKEEVIKTTVKKKKILKYFKKQLKLYINDFVFVSLTEKDFKNFLKGKNPNRIDLDLDYKRFKNDAIISKIFKRYYVWRSKPKHYKVDDNENININE